jgi:hypothetical protein
MLALANSLAYGSKNGSGRDFFVENSLICNGTYLTVRLLQKDMDFIIQF